MRLPKSALLLALALAVPAGPAAAQSWEIQDEIEFAKNMARYRLFDLATEYIQKLEKSDIPQDERLACLYARAFIEKVGGDYAVSMDDRVALLRDAIGHYNEFLGRIGPDHKNAEDARSEAAACQRKLGALLGELAAQGVEPDANRAAAEAAFRDAVKQLNALFNERKKRHDAMEDPDTSDPEYDPNARTPKDEAKFEAYDTVYQLVATYYEWAQLYPENDLNRQDYLKKCLEQANEYLWELGAESFQSYEVNFFAGLASIGLGAIEDGIANLEFILDDSEVGSGAPLVIKGNPDLPPQFVGEVVTKIVEKTYLELARLMNKQGKYADTEKLATRLEDYYKKYGDRGAKRGEYGDFFLLELGLARFRSGNPAGMKVLEDVAKRNAGNDVGQRAGELIAEAVRASTGNGVAAKLPPSTWITTADASRNQNKIFEAIDGYHQAIGAIEQIGDARERAQITVECWSDIGGCYRTLGRNVEAAMAFQEGLSAAGASKELEEELLQQVGIAWFNTLVSRFKETKDAADRKAKDEALRKLASEYNVKNTQYLVAKDEFEQARAIPPERKEDRVRAFAECADKLQDIKQDDANYDRSRVLLARCQGEQGETDPKNYEAALRTLDAFDKYAKEHEPPPEKVRLVNREVSRTESTYYRSEYLLALKRHQQVLDVLKDFEKDFAAQKPFFPEVNYRRLMALLELGRLADAEALFVDVSKKIETGELGPWRSSAGFWLSKAYLSAGEKETDPAKKKELLAKGATLMAEYSQATQHASYNNLLSAAQTWAAIEEWAKADEVYSKLLEVFGKDAQYQDDIEQRVKRSLAEVRMQQRKFKEAESLFQALELRFPKDPTVLRAAALCYGGWLEVVDRKVVEVPGSGAYKHAIDLWDKLEDQGFTREQKMVDPGWFEAKLQAIYCRYRAKDVDAAYFPQAQKIMKNFYDMVVPFIDQADLLQRIGGEDGKKKWEYLREKLR